MYFCEKSENKEDSTKVKKEDKGEGNEGWV